MLYENEFQNPQIQQTISLFSEQSTLAPSFYLLHSCRGGLIFVLFGQNLVHFCPFLVIFVHFVVNSQFLWVGAANIFIQIKVYLG
jgi:hypothetical protein